MKREVLGSCPVCEDDLEVNRLSCNNCQTQIEGNFKLCKFCRLTAEQKYFIEIFLKNRGNIKEIEKELGISYPTVRGRLENIIESLGYNSRESQKKVDRKAILEELSQGNIRSDQALLLLKGKETL